MSLTRGAFVLAAAMLWGCAVSPPAEVAAPHLQSPSNSSKSSFPESEAVEAKLRQPIDVDFKDATLRQIVEHLEKTVSVQIVVNWEELAREPTVEPRDKRVDPAPPVNPPAPKSPAFKADATITLRLNAVPANHVLKLALFLLRREQESNGLSDANILGFDIRKGKVHVSTLGELRSHRFSRTYHYRELVESPLARVTGIVTHNGRIAYADQPPLRDDSKTDDPIQWRWQRVPTREELIEQITTLVQDTVGDQEEWAAYGGEVSSLRELKPWMPVHTREAYHRQIESLLAMLFAGMQSDLRRNHAEKEIAALLDRANQERIAGRWDRARALTKDAVFVQPDHPLVQAMQRALAFGDDAPSRPRMTTNQFVPAWGNVAEGLDTEDAVSAPARANLNKQIEVNFKDARLDDVFEHVRKQAQLNIFVDWETLEVGGIEADARIDLAIKDARVSTVLKRICEQAGAGSSHERVSYGVEQNVVLVTHPRQLQRNPTTQVYDLRDLLEASAYWHPLSPQREARSANDTTRKEDELLQQMPTRDEVIEHITTLVQDTVGNQPDWAAYGGEVASLRELNSKLIVKAPSTYHPQIKELLAALREPMIEELIRVLSDDAIEAILGEADTLRLAGQHDAAIMRVEHALKLRGNHQSALALKTVLVDTLRRKRGSP